MSPTKNPKLSVSAKTMKKPNTTFSKLTVRNLPWLPRALDYSLYTIAATRMVNNAVSGQA
jgi:hypothetical protein